jgi:hypothetical protein
MVLDSKVNRCNTKAFRENPLICAVQFKFMKSWFAVLLILFFIAIGCSKSNSSAGPNIGLKSYTNAVYNDGRDFQAVLTFTQKNSNVSGDSLVIIRHRYNQSYVADPRDTFPTRLPDIPNDPSGNFTATLFWADLEYGVNGENDTCDFRFVLIDQNFNHSDTVTTGKVIIYQ